MRPAPRKQKTLHRPSLTPTPPIPAAVHLTPTAATEFGKRNGSSPRSRRLHSHSLKATRSTLAQLPQVGRCEEWNIKELRRQVATAFGRFRAREDALAGSRDAEGAALVRIQGCLVYI